MVSAVGWLTDDAAGIALSLLHAWGTPIALQIGLAGAAARRSPIPGRILDAGLREPRCRARAIKAIAELGVVGRLSAARDCLSEATLDVRFAAAWTVARFATDARAIAELQTIAMTESRYRQRSAALAVRRLEPMAARRWVEMLAQVPGCERVAIQAAGALGDPVFVPWLLEQMSNPSLARLAGESFCLITGARLAEDKLDVATAGSVRGPPDGRPGGFPGRSRPGRWA